MVCLSLSAAQSLQVIHVLDPVSLERQTCKSFVGRQRRAFSTAEAAAEKLEWKLHREKRQKNVIFIF